MVVHAGEGRSLAKSFLWHCATFESGKPNTIFILSINLLLEMPEQVFRYFGLLTRKFFWEKGV